MSILVVPEEEVAIVFRGNLDVPSTASASS
jgi:hypothetical protein